MMGWNDVCDLCVEGHVVISDVSFIFSLRPWIRSLT